MGSCDEGDMFRKGGGEKRFRETIFLFFIKNEDEKAGEGGWRQNAEQCWWFVKVNEFSIMSEDHIRSQASCHQE